MQHVILRPLLLLTVALALPGCLAVNAFLGAAGLIATGPLQYAGAVYSVSEYTYEYAVNNRTPDEVIGRKLARLELPLKPGPEPGHGLTGYAKAIRSTSMDGSTPFVRDNRQKEIHIVTPKEIQIVRQSVIAHPAAPPQAAKKPSPDKGLPSAVATETRTRQPVTPVVVARLLPIHTYIEHDTDPLLLRLDRLEQTFGQAERVALKQPDSGVRMTASTPEAGESEPGISGSWFIRHRVMHGPRTAGATQPAGHVVLSAMTSLPPI